MALFLSKAPRDTESQPSPPYVGAVFLVAAFVAAVIASQWARGPTDSQLRQAQAFAEDWQIEVIDAATMPGRSAVAGTPVAVRISGGARQVCSLSTWFRNRKSGKWEHVVRSERGVGSGWQRLELTCLEPRA